MEKPKVINAIECEGCNVPKGWGHEVIFVNNELYCGKLLVFKKGAKFSMHYHLIKDETWYVDKGEFVYRWIDTETAEVIEQQLKVMLLHLDLLVKSIQDILQKFHLF